MEDVNFSMFKGIEPEMDMELVYDKLGDPDDMEYFKEDGDPGYYYYFFYPEGTIILAVSDYWGLGLIRYLPKTNLYIESIVHCDIKSQKKSFEFYCKNESMRKFDIFLDKKNRTITRIDWWNN
ncbi:hypothetical protein ERX46_05370 [Brumimicrobium glaciale]|uniref:Uncharacterized protein n=1 Tax=Brumimicrobium glaciale TaxID=200475 RepID=A0A4Q4KN48_9FLAO|nr:hypothetical protein [Brumimicrobium glaciale]RYM34805.1 hypothetical protein ERX46_05370 [Brumimicrobium glaciale]